MRVQSTAMSQSTIREESLLIDRVAIFLSWSGYRQLRICDPLYHNAKRTIYAKTSDHTDSGRYLVTSSAQNCYSKSPPHSFQRSAEKKQYGRRAPVRRIHESNSRNTNNHSARSRPTCLSTERKALPESENFPQSLIRTAKARSFPIPHEMGAYAKRDRSVSMSRKSRNNNDLFKQCVIECKPNKFSNVNRQSPSTLQAVCYADECSVAPRTSTGYRKLSFCELCQADYEVGTAMQAGSSTDNSCQYPNMSSGVDRAVSPAVQNQVIIDVADWKGFETCAECQMTNSISSRQSPQLDCNGIDCNVKECSSSHDRSPSIFHRFISKRYRKFRNRQTSRDGDYADATCHKNAPESLICATYRKVDNYDSKQDEFYRDSQSENSQTCNCKSKSQVDIDNLSLLVNKARSKEQISVANSSESGLNCKKYGEKTFIDSSNPVFFDCFCDQCVIVPNYCEEGACEVCERLQATVPCDEDQYSDSEQGSSNLCCVGKSKKSRKSKRKKSSKENSTSSRWFGNIAVCLNCMFPKTDHFGSSSGGSGSDDEGDDDDAAEDFDDVEHGEAGSDNDGSDGGSDSESDEDESMDSLDLYDDQMNALDAKDNNGDDGSDDGGDPGSECTDSLTELGSGESEEVSDSSDDDDDDDDIDCNAEDDLQSIIIDERE